MLVDKIKRLTILFISILILTNTTWAMCDDSDELIEFSTQNKSFFLGNLNTEELDDFIQEAPLFFAQNVYINGDWKNVNGNIMNVIKNLQLQDIIKIEYKPEHCNSLNKLVKKINSIDVKKSDAFKYYLNNLHNQIFMESQPVNKPQSRNISFECLSTESQEKEEKAMQFAKAIPTTKDIDLLINALQTEKEKRTLGNN